MCQQDQSFVQNILSISDVIVTLPNNETLEVKDFHMRRGEQVTMVGEVGCGKTTFLKVLCGLYHCWNGNIKVCNTLLNEIPPNKSPAVMVWQDNRLFDHMSVIENVAYPLIIRGESKNYAYDEAAKELDTFDIDKEKFKESPARLSGGQIQLVSIARSLIAKPFLLLLDEPFRNIDRPKRRRIESILQDVAKRDSISMIIVSHDILDVYLVGRKIAIINSGLLTLYHDIDHVLNNISDSKVLDLLGETNLLNGGKNFVLLHSLKLHTTEHGGSNVLAGKVTHVVRTPCGYIVEFETLGDRKKIWRGSTEIGTKFKVGQDIWVTWSDQDVLSLT